MRKSIGNLFGRWFVIVTKITNTLFFFDTKISLLEIYSIAISAVFVALTDWKQFECRSIDEGVFISITIPSW